MKKVVLLLVIVLCSSIFLSGCFLTDQIAALKQGFNQEKNVSDSTADTPTVVIETTQTAVMDGPTQTIALYFKDANQRLVLEERAIGKVEGIARATMQELIKGPAQAGLEATLPVNTQLLDINIRPDGLAIVDFSGELVTDLPASETAEKLAVYSIVNTLTQFPTVEKVELRVDGQRVSTLLGYVDVEPSLVRDASLIK
ncbi:MAG: GerMN domain-containing protein [Clostridia bacterium]|nr:GerMN domain-containing protein [Clostridia bacterium]